MKEDLIHLLKDFQFSVVEDMEQSLGEKIEAAHVADIEAKVVHLIREVHELLGSSYEG